MGMDWDCLGPDAWKQAEEILGYLNFSSGAPDPRFLHNLNALFGRVAATPFPSPPEPAWRALARALQAGLQRLRGSGQAFRNVEQAEGVLSLVFDVVLPGYRQFHRDLLFHHTEESLFQPFWIGRVCEAVLAAGGPWDDRKRILQGALTRLNDFLGHRPVAVLRTAQKIQPYAHERVRPIPLYIRGAGLAFGRFREVIQHALAILAATDTDLLDQAGFDPQLLDELAVDPRAYDFDHPVHRRPNYQFGGWDPHHIDHRGLYRRFVLQEVTLDGLMRRVEEGSELPRDEIALEAAAVLAGTMLMGSAVTGNGPEAHDSSTTLATLVPRIAACRDAFYERLLGRMGGAHGERLRAEAAALRQPFAGARQHLNHTLARRRARQLQHVHLARLFARMGFTEAAVEQAHVVPVASARMRCEIDCRLTTAHRAIDRKQLKRAAALVPEIEDLLHRAIECGAMVDPWNILGFGGHFSCFPSPEDSIRDERIDELVELLSEIFALCARLAGEAAAAGEEKLGERVSRGLAELARWWDRFASTEVSGVPGVSGREAWESSAQVAAALGAWRRAETAAGDVAFWRQHAQRFRSPKAYALLVDIMLQKRDFVASMALLVHWLSQADEIPLAEGAHSFHAAALRWMENLWGKAGTLRESPDAAGPSAPNDLARQWELARKFLDYFEANAEAYWHVPRLELARSTTDQADNGPEEPPEEDSNGLFGAAYENVTYRDTTDDGFEGEMLEGGIPASDFELAHEAERISGRLAFLITSSRLWKSAAVASAGVASAERDDVLAGWLAQALRRRRELEELLVAVHRYRIPSPSGSYESLVEFDRRQGIKEMLLERIVAASIESINAARLISAAMARHEPGADPQAWERAVAGVLRAAFRSDAAAVRRDWPSLLDQLSRQPLLYVPLHRGGNPQRVVAARSLQQVIRGLMHCLPRLGLLGEAYRLLETVEGMERDHPAGPGAITEFDHIFEIACRGILGCLIASSDEGQAVRQAARPSPARADRVLAELVEQTVELLLRRWLAHNRRVRISVLEHLADEERWTQLQRFIQRYGGDLFTPKFMTYANLRAILHQGVDAYLRSLQEQPAAEGRVRLLEDLDGRVTRQTAVRLLEWTVEAVVENYAEYHDYKVNTTQSDRGELLYILLDFLRLKAGYERVAWNLWPVIVAHDVLLQSGRGEAAARWQRAITQRTRTLADEQLQQYEQLCTRHGVRLRSIGERLGERFVQPLAVTRLRAWVRPAMAEIRAGRSSPSFAALRREMAPFAAEPSGAGVDVPAWLDALAEEVQAARSGVGESDEPATSYPQIPQVRLSLEQIRRQLESWQKR